MKTNLIELVNQEFKDMSFNEKIMFLKDYKQSVELLPNNIKNYTEVAHKGNKNSLILELLQVIPPAYQLEKRTYYIKMSKKNSYDVFDLHLIVAFGKILKHQELIEKTYKLIVFMQKNTLWRDCNKLGIAKTHFNTYWHFHPNKTSLYKLVRLNEYWPYLIDLICDIYSFFNHIINYHESFKSTFKNQEEPQGIKNEDYPIVGLKLDPYSYNIEYN